MIISYDTYIVGIWDNLQNVGDSQERLENYSSFYTCPKKFWLIELGQWRA